MSRAEPLAKKADYYTIKEGSFRLPTSKEDPEAIVREYTNPKTKEEGVAYERGFKALFGMIKDIKFTETTLKDGTRLRSLNIVLDENESGKEQIISIPEDSRYTSDFLKRLPNLDLNKEVRLMPYDFEPKVGPRQVGISLTQQNEDGEFTVKIANFFLEEGFKDGKIVYKNSNGLPDATPEDSQDWPFYFKKVNKFLVSYTKEHIIPKFSKDGRADAALEEVLEDKKTGPNPDDVPF